MAILAGRTVAALLGVVLVAGSAACGSSGDDADPVATSAAQSSGTGSPTGGTSPAAASPAPTYRLVNPLCGEADIGPLSDAYRPDDNKPLRNSERSCVTGMLSKGPNRVVMTLSLQAYVTPDGGSAEALYESNRRGVRFGTAMDLLDVGSRAHWYTNGQDVEIVGYDGNLSLTMTFGAANADNRLPPGIPERMAKAMNGTFRNLAS